MNLACNKHNFHTCGSVFTDLEVDDLEDEDDHAANDEAGDNENELDKEAS